MKVIDGQGQVGGGRGLTNYMSREGHELKNAAGREMDDLELDEFHRKCDENDFARQFVLAPSRNDLTEEELDRHAREAMNGWAADKDSLEYCYSIHNDDGNNHVHVCMTASKESGDLWLDGRDEVLALEDNLADRWQDHTTERQQEMMLEQGREEELAQERAARSLNIGGDGGPDRTDDGPALTQALKIGKDMMQKSRESEQQRKENHNDRDRDRGGRSR